MPRVIPFALLVSAALAIGMAALAQRRPSTRGVRPFSWLGAAIAWWCIAGAAHALAETLDS